MNRKLQTTFILLSLFFSSFLFAQIPLSPSATISVLTCDKGNELYSHFGHTAIRIQDKENALDVVYNYGTFDFSTPNFYLKFIKGDLDYFVSCYAYNEFYFEYTLENRSIYEQILNLNKEQKQKLFDSLNKSLMGKEKFYRYKFIDKNCTTMVSDKINETLGEKCIRKVSTNKNLSYRAILYPYLEQHFYENLGINIIFGARVDEEGRQLFLPNQLMESLSKAKFQGNYLSSKPKTILSCPKENSYFSWWNNYYTFCLALFLILISRNKKLYYTYFALIGILGIFLSLVGFYSNHSEVARNYNVLLLNPLVFFILYFDWKQKVKYLKMSLIVYTLFLIVFSIILLNKPNLVMFLPMIVTSAFICFFIKKKKSKTK